MPDHRELLGVLLTEVDELGPHDVEQLQAHGRDATEVAWAVLALETARELLHVHPGLETRRVHLGCGGSKQDVDARCFGDSGVAGLVSG